MQPENHRHDWQKEWSDGTIGRVVCRDCGKGVLLPVGDLGWWGAKPKLCGDGGDNA